MLLTAEIRPLIQTIKQRSGGEIFLRFYPDGTLCLAVNNMKALFAVDDYTESAERLQNRAESELNRLADLIALLSQVIRQAVSDTCIEFHS